MIFPLQLPPSPGSVSSHSISQKRSPHRACGAQALFALCAIELRSGACHVWGPAKNLWLEFTTPQELLWKFSRAGKRAAATPSWRWRCISNQNGTFQQPCLLMRIFSALQLTIISPLSHHLIGDAAQAPCHSSISIPTQLTTSASQSSCHHASLASCH
jgi:hypothetical protein